MTPLAIIPAYLTRPEDVVVLGDTLRTLRGTAGDEVDVIVVDDGSPDEELVEQLAGMIPQWNFDLHLKEENSGFANSVNVGLRRALEQERDAILVNADILFRAPGWVKLMLEQENLHQPGLAWVVGGLLAYPNGIVQFGGTYFSLLTRDFNHRWQYAPEDLPEANVPSVTPITGALQFIRHEALATIGVYDDDFRLGWEDVDFCLRVMLAGQECVYQPLIRAYHLESFFRGRPSLKIKRWTDASWLTLAGKYRHHNFVGLVPAF